MNWGKRLLIGFIISGIVGGTYAGSKKSDPDILARMGKVVGEKAYGALPSSSNVAGPLSSFRLEARLPLEERVQIRIRSDVKLDGTDVTVASGSTPGEVRLRGLVQSAEQAQRAVRLAESTKGVTKVIDELARPE